MRKIILAPDSFKGTMSSMEICEIMERAALDVFPGCEVIKLPVADGGEGTVSAMLAAAGGERKNLSVTGPEGKAVSSFYGKLKSGASVIEMAAAAGLPMVKGREDPRVMSTFGVGELIRDAVGSGAREILLGLGGSCTNDGGCGAAAALGVRFADAEGREFIPVGGSLDRIAGIDTSEARAALKGVRIRMMCDVDNPLFGENGAAYIFGPQKGADDRAVRELDRGLRHLGALLEPMLPGVSQKPGAGAAGGMGAGMAALLGAEFVSGIDGVLDATCFEEKLSGCDMVFTGEGRIDGQSLRGKVVFGVCRRAKPHGVPVCAIVGDSIDGELAGAYENGLCAVFTTNRLAVPFHQARQTAREDMYHTMKNALTFAKALK